MKREWKKSRRGFTLIEVLVTLAVVAVLVSLSMMGVRKASDGAKAARCLSDLKQTGMALSLYASDNNGNLPEPYIPKAPWTWPFILQQGGYFPPKWGTSPSDIPSCQMNPQYRATYTYGMNDFLTTKIMKFSDATTPSKTLLISDSICPAAPSNSYRVGTSTSYGQLAFLHGKSCNVLYWDGHAEGLTTVPETTGLRVDNTFWNPSVEGIRN